ncbi:hypothetical protein EV424DRAFT_1343545 [Suillus variegatus]|nr:hypothetical protein EV424DRAFT_1343545 [Suillus variegatus]
MPAAPWTTKVQYTWLQEQLPEYIQQSTGDKDYSCFWPTIHKYWFKTWPERNILFPDIPGDMSLTVEQTKQEVKAEEQCKVQLATWFRWRAGSSKKNRGLKKEQTVFDAALRPKTRAKSVEEIYMGMVYDEQIKPLVKAEQEAGNVTTSGHRMALGRRFSKELLEDELDEVKKEVRKRYNKQIKGSKGKGDILDDEDDDNDESDPDAIAKGIDELPIICQRFACLVKKQTQFIVSFMCTGPDPRHNQDIVTLSCHPSETSGGRNLTHLYPDEDYAFLGAYQEFAELLFSAKEHDPLLPATMNVGDGNRSEELEEDGSSKEDESGEEDESREENEGGTVVLAPAGFADASLQLMGPFYSQSQYPDWSLDLHSVMMPQASAPLGSIEPFEARFLQPGLMATGYLGSSTLPTLPAANPPSPTETAQPAEVPDSQAGTGRAKSKCKSKSKLPTTKSLTAHTDKPRSAAEFITDTPTVTATPTTAKLTPLVNSTEPIPVITLVNAAKPKTKPKPKPKANPVSTKSSAVTEMTHVTADEGNMLGDSITINNIMQKATASQIGAARVSKRIPIKSRQNDIADAIGSDGMTFVGIGSKENPSVLEEVGGTSSKCTADSTAEGVIPTKNRKRRTKA